MNVQLEVKYNKLFKLKNLDNKINELVAYCKTISENKLETYLTFTSENRDKSYLEQEKINFSQDYFTNSDNIYSRSKNKFGDKIICDLLLDEEETLVICASLHNHLVKQKIQLENELI